MGSLRSRAACDLSHLVDNESRNMWNRAVYAIESLLRRSSIGHRIRDLGIHHPNLHRLLLWSRALVLPYRRFEGLSRYQARAIQKFLDIARGRDLMGKVLEVGSDKKGAVAAHLYASGARQVIGINPSTGAWRSERISRLVLLIGADALKIPIADGSLDAIFSVATFEHIQNLELAMQEFFRVLRPGGILFSDFGPIWSSSVGHHVYAKVGEQEARHWKPGLNPVPDFGHLLYSRVEMTSKLEGECSPELTDAIVEWIYDGQGINRLFYEDYLGIFESSPFKLDSLIAVTEHIGENDLLRLRGRHPTYRRFDCRMVEAVFHKE